MRTVMDLIHENTYFIDWETKEATLIDHDDEAGFYLALKEENFYYCDAVDFEEWLNGNYNAFQLYSALLAGNSMEDIYDEYVKYYEEKLYEFMMNSEYFAWL